MQGQESVARTSSSDVSTEICDGSYLLSIFDPREIIFPLSWRKIAYLTAVLGVVAGGAYLECAYEFLAAAVDLEDLGVMSLFYFFEPVSQLVIMTIADYPVAATNTNSAEIEEDNSHDRHQGISISIASPYQEKNKEIAIIIPCHQSRALIEKTLKSCLRHVFPHQIFVIDNGNSPVPLDDTLAIIRAVDPSIRYVWSHIGNKTLAEYIGAIIADEYKYILQIDDDTCLPEKVEFLTSEINENTKAVCFPIKAGSLPEKTSLIMEWQDLEYKLCDLSKAVQAKHCGVLYPHGAASLWDRQIYIKILRMHDTVFYADDVKQGLLLRQLGFKMTMSAGVCFSTDVPKSFLGKLPNYYDQRVRSWEMSRVVYLWKFLAMLPRVNHFSIKETIILKLFQLNEVYGVFADVFRSPLLILMSRNPLSLAKICGIYSWHMVPALLWNYVKLPQHHRQDLQVNLKACITYPIYKLIHSMMCVGGALRAVFIYLPNFQAKPTIPEIEKIELNNQGSLLSEMQDSEKKDLITYKKILHNRFFKSANNAVHCIEEKTDVTENNVALFASNFRNV